MNLVLGGHFVEHHLTLSCRKILLYGLGLSFRAFEDVLCVCVCVGCETSLLTEEVGEGCVDIHSCKKCVKWAAYVTEVLVQGRG